MSSKGAANLLEPGTLRFRVSPPCCRGLRRQQGPVWPRTITAGWSSSLIFKAPIHRPVSTLRVRCCVFARRGRARSVRCSAHPSPPHALPPGSRLPPRAPPPRAAAGAIVREVGARPQRRRGGGEGAMRIAPRPLGPSPGAACSIPAACHARIAVSAAPWTPTRTAREVARPRAPRRSAAAPHPPHPPARPACPPPPHARPRPRGPTLAGADRQPARQAGWHLRS